MEGEDVAQAPRNLLRRLIDDASTEGMHVKTGIEAEFFLLSPDGSQISDEYDTAAKPCYDQQAVMRRYDIVKEICDYMLEMGWGPYQNDHEDANGQFEMNWEFDDALATADKHSFFKFMTKSIAEKHGFRATFMPKPIEGLTGNGCHAHISVWDAPGSQAKRNMFATTSSSESQTSELGLSEKGRNFLGGLMTHAPALTAVTNPTVNSYKRLNAPRTVSGATWAPNSVTWTGNNRTHMVRIPGPGRFELRLADGATNPYLLQAVIIAAGLSGVRSKADPGKRYDIHCPQVEQVDEVERGGRGEGRAIYVRLNQPRLVRRRPARVARAVSDVLHPFGLNYKFLANPSRALRSALSHIVLRTIIL